MAEKNLKKTGTHLLSGALDEKVTSRGNEIVLRGVVDPASLGMLRVDEYQREALPLAALTKLWQALRDGESLPDIELGMRSLDFDSAGDSDFWLPGDKVYIIDGQQRRNAAVHILSLMPDLKVRLGAMIHFGTTRPWERERFKILNLDRTRVSTNVLMRNMRHESAAVLTLYGLSYNEPDFALFERVCWKQAQKQNELITARTLATVAGALHAHRSPAFRNSIAELIPALDRQAKFVKLELWRKNIAEFFDLVDHAWGIRNISMRELSLQIRSTFLTQLALVISDHMNFWRGDHETELYIETEWQKRFATFPLHDPAIVNILSSGSGGGWGGAQTSLIYTLLRDHLNKGKSEHRLVNRKDKQAAEAPQTFSSDAPEDEIEDADLERPRT